MIDLGKTHYEGCWREHMDCAVTEVERLREIIWEAPHTPECLFFMMRPGGMGSAKCTCWKAKAGAQEAGA